MTMNSTNSHGTVVETTGEAIEITTPPARKKPGPRPGTARPPRRAATSAGGESSTPAKGGCPHCSTKVETMDLALVREMVRSAREEMDDMGDGGGMLAVSRIRYLAARFDGFCSLKCWRERG